MGPAAALAEAVGHHRAGRLPEAEAIYRRILTTAPHNPDALHLLGVVALQVGEYGAAEGLAARAIGIDGRAAAFHATLGKALCGLGRDSEAEAACRRSLALDPDYAEAGNTLGIALLALGRAEEAATAQRQALAIEPAYAQAHNNLGNALDALGETGDAIGCYRRAIDLQPDYFEAHNNLGKALQALGELDAARDAYGQALDVEPGNADIHYNMGTVLMALDQPAEAAEACRRALSLRPDFARAHNNLGTALESLGLSREAEAAFRDALAIEPEYAEAHFNLGNASRSQGRLGDGAVAYRRALGLRPGFLAAHSNLLLCLYHDPSVTAPEFLAESRRWNDCHAAPLTAGSAPHANQPDPERRLRVGYVSPDFRRHAVSYFVEPLIEAHDRDAVEVFCYAEVAAPDAVTERYRDRADGWCDTVGMSDSEVAARVRADRIDILVDLAGHTAGNRLLAFAERPAPVQVSHMVGFGQTTGMTAMDYLLTDSILAPEGSDALSSETPWRLPGCYASFRPSPDWPDVTPLPAAARGFLRFASFAGPQRIEPGTVALWSRVLQAVPGSRLLLKNPLLAEGGARDRLRQCFADHGVSDRVDIEGVERGWAAGMDAYGTVDMVLDTYPLSGGTTTCIALWMGLPVITLVGDDPRSRFGLDYLEAAGLGDTAATDRDGYVARAVRLAGDLDGLAEMRAGLRARMSASPLLDHAGLARAVEDAYRAMWRNWCATGNGG